MFGDFDFKGPGFLVSVARFRVQLGLRQCGGLRVSLGVLQTCKICLEGGMPTFHVSSKKEGI